MADKNRMNDHIVNSEILQQDYFQLFGIPQNYEIDQVILQQQFHELQRRFHPDNFAGQGESVGNQMLILSSHINHAYDTLNSPLLRAIYLLGLHGIIVDLIHDTKFSNQFLLEQIELREQISSAEETADFEELEQIEHSLLAETKNIQQKISELFTIKHYPEIVELIKQLAFYNKLEHVVGNVLSNL